MERLPLINYRLIQLMKKNRRPGKKNLPDKTYMVSV